MSAFTMYTTNLLPQAVRQPAPVDSPTGFQAGFPTASSAAARRHSPARTAPRPLT